MGMVFLSVIIWASMSEPHTMECPVVVVAMVVSSSLWLLILHISCQLIIMYVARM